jgi:hypothetical protein
MHREDFLSLGQPLCQGNKLPHQFPSFRKSSCLHLMPFTHRIVKLTMNIKNKYIELHEYKFHYHLGDDLGAADKYFLAHDRKEASDMFCYACNKKRLNLHDLYISKWNRWKGEWEVLSNYPSCSPGTLN